MNQSPEQEQKKAETQEIKSLSNEEVQELERLKRLKVGAEVKKLEEEQVRHEARKDSNMMQAPKKFQPVEYAREPSPEDKLLKSLVKNQLFEKE